MTILLQQMTVAEYANARVAVGDRVERIGAVYWVRTKRFFYRPLLPYEVYSLSKSDVPLVGLGGFEHVVADAREANAAMSFLMLDDVRDYALEKLGHKRRLLIKNAARRFVIRPVQDPAEFKEQGFQAYLSFYQRTHYQYRSKRRHRENFRQWAKAIIESPKAVVLGGYGQSGLTAVSVSYWVGETLLYATFFSSTSALEEGVGELMFHTLREAASQAHGIREMFVRRYQGGDGRDKYYLLRGAKLIHKPARLCLNPLSEWILKTCFPGKLALLIGSERNGEPETK